MMWEKQKWYNCSNSGKLRGEMSQRGSGQMRDVNGYKQYSYFRGRINST